MILRLTVSPNAAVAKNAFVHDSRVALSVRHVFDFRTYSQLDLLFPVMRTLLWDEFGDDIEISRFFDTSNPCYTAEAQDFNLLWEWLESVHKYKTPFEIPQKLVDCYRLMPTSISTLQRNLRVHTSEPDINDPGF